MRQDGVIRATSYIAMDGPCCSAEARSTSMALYYTCLHALRFIFLGCPSFLLSPVIFLWLSGVLESLKDSIVLPGSDG